MATTTARTPGRPARRKDGFDVVASDRALGLNFPQRLAERLWALMLVMGVMGLVAGLISAIVRADAISTGDSADTIARLHHVTAALTFIGFTGVFSAIVFSIARILGVFRTGGGRLQQAVGGEVQTLRMPLTAKAMIALMAMGMMALVIPVILHFVAAASIVGSSEAELLRGEQWFVVLENIRRLGIVTYLLAFLFGLGTIIHVLRFQALRVRELVRPTAG